jgi:hypothetical protein
MQFQKAYSPAWEHYIAKDKSYDFKEDQCGGWQYSFDASHNSLSIIRKICEKAMTEGVVAEIKHSNADALRIKGSGLCCFYCNGDDEEAHKKIIAFFIQNNMVLRDNYGNLRNMAFKYDATAKRRKKGSIPIQLGDFVNLKTGEFKSKSGESI